jgi:uncharacterized repeat protein (TIGR03803 family)
MARLIQGSDGNFYETTFYGGMNDAGIIFKITPTGTFTVLHDFEDTYPGKDGTNPIAPLVEGKDGNFYGTTSGGGLNSGGGTVFKLTPGGTYTVIHTFNGGNTDGAESHDGLIQGKDGNFYGTTTRGGSSAIGTVYKITPGGTFTFLRAFDGNDGSNPVGELVEAGDGNFYGVTGESTSGTIFRITPQGRADYAPLF